MGAAQALAAGAGLGEDALVSSSAPDGSVHWWSSDLNGSFRRLLSTTVES